MNNTAVRIKGNLLFFSVSLLYSYYFLLMTSNLSHGYSRWDYFILVSFSAFYVFNLCIFWVDLRTLPVRQSLFLLLTGPLFTAGALLENPVKFYTYYFNPFINYATGRGLDIVSYIKYYRMDKYYFLVFQFLACIGIVKLFILVFFKKKY